MKTIPRFSKQLMSGQACILLLLMGSSLSSKPIREIPSVEEAEGYVDVVGDRDGSGIAPRKALSDTIWIANWSFDVGGPCSDAGWEKVDLRILNDGQLYWDVVGQFDGSGGIIGNAAALGHTCCDGVEGYDNDWYQAIRIEYSGDGALTFDYLLDSETDWDYLRVELDSACASFDLSDYSVDPQASPADFRKLEFEDTGLNLEGVVSALPITGFGTSETHCLYVAFMSDELWSPCDYGLPTNIGKALVVDHIELTGVNEPVSEDFEGTIDSHISFVNIQPDQPFGNWARTFEHITDNDVCTENTTCAWLFSDDTTPTISNDPSMFFAPGGYVIRNWLDNAIVSPWVSLASTTDAIGTILHHKLFGGNSFSRSRICLNWSVRGRGSEGRPSECVDPWGHTLTSWAIGGYTWFTGTVDMTPHFEPTASAIQVRYRVWDAQELAWISPPSPFVPGPGPFIDEVRIGRIHVSGPGIFFISYHAIGNSLGNAWQAQDAFPTEVDPTIPSGAGERFRPATDPTTDRFGTAAFSMGADLGSWTESPNLIPGDSIVVMVEDLRDSGGISSVEWYGAIVSGPHAGKAPPPWTVASNGFFSVPPDSAGGVLVETLWYVDLDDDYFRGGDVLLYYWLARDALGGVTTRPEGLATPPGSVEEAEQLTGGLLEVSFLPTIDWDPGYLARIAADAHGKLEPTANELANSFQANCILYSQTTNLGRRSGDTNRTSFMYTLDRLGYRGAYDVYDHMGYGSANNDLGGRATVTQASGYALIVHDNGLGGNLPDGTNLLQGKVDQSGWYRNWLSGAVESHAGTATLWVLGADMADRHYLDPLLFDYMGVALAKPDVAIDMNPDVVGQASFTFENGRTVDFTSDWLTLDGGCPQIHQYDAIEASGSALVTHRFQKRQQAFEGSVIMNRNTTEHWNTILMAFPWFDIVDPTGSPSSPTPEEQLLAKVLNGVLPVDCMQSQDPTDTDADEPETENVPKQTALHQNVPNPFNPTTTIRFDLAREAHVRLSIYDISGRLVRALVDDAMKPGFYHEVWNGLDDGGRRVASGVYLYRLQAGDFRTTRKLVVMK